VEAVASGSPWSVVKRKGQHGSGMLTRFVLILHSSLRMLVHHSPFSFIGLCIGGHTGSLANGITTVSHTPESQRRA
jgi:hypothetical protein